MYNNEVWENRKKELEVLKKQRQEISKQIHLLQIEIKQHEKHKEHKINTNTEVYKMFGKSLKDLTKNEYRIYYNARQRINRQKRKNNIIQHAQKTT